MFAPTINPGNFDENVSQMFRIFVGTVAWHSVARRMTGRWVTANEKARKTRLTGDRLGTCITSGWSWLVMAGHAWLRER